MTFPFQRQSRQKSGGRYSTAFFAASGKHFGNADKIQRNTRMVLTVTRISDLRQPLPSIHLA
jgi:hypothetical protein